MPGILDYFTSIHKIIHLLDGDRQSAPVRRTVRPRLEQLENREVLSGTSLATIGGPIAEFVQTVQLFQMIAQIDANPTANPLLTEDTVASVVNQLPGISQNLNSFSQFLSTTFGPQVGQQYTTMLIKGVDFLFSGLEGADLAAADALAAGGTGIPGNPNFNAYFAGINYFLGHPLDDPYTVPPGTFGV
ncbi:MAG TPA: hypothetical protein VE999_16680 [Gemmataceae bacterium]|nr:hypothetical protein [Gemmataceae bacterium]